MSDSAPSESAPTEGAGVTDDTPSSDGAGTRQASAPAESDLFELDDGRKVTAAELRKEWNGYRTNAAKGKNAAQIMTKADQRMREAERAKREAEEFWELAGKDPRALRGYLTKRGLNPDDFATQLLWETVQKEQMSAEQRQHYEAKKEMEAWREERRNWEQQQRQAAEERAVAQERDKYARLMNEAVAKLGLPKESSHVATRRIAAIMEKALDAEIELSVEEAAAMARDEFSGELRSLTSTLDGPALIQFLGEDVVKRLRAHDLAQIRARRPGATNATPQPHPAVANGTNGSAGRQKPLTEAERDQILRQKFRVGEHS